MNEHDVIRLVGRFPDRILNRQSGLRIKSLQWQCSGCGYIVASPTPVVNPAPCVCGGIMFEPVNEGKEVSSNAPSVPDQHYTGPRRLP
jgi:hypothetical protein